MSKRPEESKPVAKTIMDGINGPSVGARPLEVLLSHGNVDAFSVGDESALRGVRAAFDHLKLVVEPARAKKAAQWTSLNGLGRVAVADG